MPTHLMRQHNYPSFGKCIYCLTPKDELKEKLTEEHIIPFALSGTLVIKEAASEKCRKFSNEEYEQSALNTNLYVPRLLLELKRRKKTGKKFLPKVALGSALEITDLSQFDLQLEVSNYPPLLEMLIFQPAGKLIKEARTGGLNNFRVFFRHIEPKNWYSIAGKVTTRHKYGHTSYSLTLAKIAYCYAIAELDIEGFNGDEIRALLMKKRDDVYNFVGGTPETTKFANNELHKLYLRKKENLVSVIVHLFASYDAPPYEVVVGTIN